VDAMKCMRISSLLLVTRIDDITGLSLDEAQHWAPTYIHE